MLNGYSRRAFNKGKTWSFKTWKGSFIWFRWSTCAQNQKRAAIDSPPFLSFRRLKRPPRRPPFHYNISFSSPGFVLGESNAVNQRNDNIFHQLGDPGQEPSSLAKIRPGYSCCHSAPVVPHSKYTNLSLLTLIIHKQHKGWNRAGWSLFMAPKCFFLSEDLPKAFLSRSQPRAGLILSDLSSPIVSIFNRSICLILRMKIWETKNMSNGGFVKSR